MTRKFLHIVILLILLSPTSGFAQIYGNNTIELQNGNLPFEEDSVYPTVYNNLNLFYDSGNLSFYSRIEYFDAPFDSRDYFDLTQKKIQYQDDRFRVRVGNFYETLGRGLLLRSFDIPGSVFEDSFERTRYAFFRDIEGISVDYTSEKFELKALRGTALFNPLPPNFENENDRRPDLVEAVEATYYINSMVSAGGIYMRHNATGTDYDEYAAIKSDVTPIDNIQFFTEYAFSTSSAFNFDKAESFAFYAGTNFYYGSFGGAFEYKNYNNFLLGSGFNDPPSLIKEHTYPVLNRSTHVLETSDESGVQLELYYNFEGGHSIVGNYTSATNDLFSKFEYREYFLEGVYELNSSTVLKSFFDYAKDDLKGEEDRISFGFIGDKTFGYQWNAILDLQYQTFKRPFDPKKTENIYSAISLAYLPDVVVSIIVEASTDPQLTDNPTTFSEEESGTRYWVGGNFSYQFDQTHSLDIFAGKRRGGPACTSGICYEILDFEGIELRFSTRF